MALKKFEANEEELKQAYRELGSMKKVAVRYGVSKKLILNYMNKYGIKRQSIDASDTIKDIRSLALKGKTSIQIADELSYSLTQVNNISRN